MEGLACQVPSQKVEALRHLVHQTLAPKHPLLEASRPGGLEGLAGQAFKLETWRLGGLKGLESLEVWKGLESLEAWKGLEAWGLGH